MTPEEVRAVRRALGWSQRRLGEELGVSRFAVCHWEAGRRHPRNRHVVTMRELVMQENITSVSANEGKVILNRQAQKYLGMTGDELVRRHRAGEIEDADRTDVIRVALLIPLAEQ